MQIVIAMVACAAASDVPELTPEVKAATDFHNAAHAAAKTVGLGGAAPSFFQPDTPAVHFTKLAHLNQLSYETARNTGYHYGAYPYGAYPYHYGAGHLALRKKRQVPEQTPEVKAATAFHLSALKAAHHGYPVHHVSPLAYSYSPVSYAYGAYPYHYGAGQLALRKKRQAPEDYAYSSVDLNQDGQPDNKQFAYPYAYGAYPYQYGAYPYVY